MKLVIIALAALLATACGSTKGNAFAPTPTAAAPVVMAYEINIPNADLAIKLNAQYPDGVRMAPIQAQFEWDYTSVYGTANVYYGPFAPGLTAAGTSPYQGTSIVIAPAQVASEAIFSGEEWPIAATGLPLSTRFEWVGRFVFAQIGRAH